MREALADEGVGGDTAGENECWSACFVGVFETGEGVLEAVLEDIGDSDVEAVGEVLDIFVVEVSFWEGLDVGADGGFKAGERKVEFFAAFHRARKGEAF